MTSLAFGMYTYRILLSYSQSPLFSGVDKIPDSHGPLCMIDHSEALTNLPGFVQIPGSWRDLCIAAASLVPAIPRYIYFCAVEAFSYALRLFPILAAAFNNLWDAV